MLTLLAIDYGKTNIGLALGRNSFVTPLEIISGKDIEGAIHKITRIAMENKVDKFIVGIPLDAEGKDTPQSIEVRKFAKKLKMQSRKTVDFQNEFGTSKEALNTALDLQIPQKKRRTNDHLSAALILKSYYENLTP